MERILITPRNKWQAQVESQGFIFHTPKSDEIYWDESAAYKFTAKEVDTLETATVEVYDMFLQVAQRIIDENLFYRLKIPEAIIPYLKDSWNQETPAIYGRFDFSYSGGNSVPKLLEFNADTPTSLFEAAIIQWYWLQSYDKTQDQFNSIHEKLVDYWAYLKNYLKGGKVYFACIKENIEDFTTTEYFRDCCMQAGIETQFIDISMVGYNANLNQFVDEKDQPIHNLFKLYPWEWLANESFCNYFSNDICLFIEPAWKMLFSNKAVLPLLYEMFPHSEYLLPAFFDSHGMTDYVKKPILSREGANVAIYKGGKPIEVSGGEYGSEGYIFQELCELPNFDNNYPVIGSWVIGQKAAGIGIREASTLITTDKSRFIPHFIETL